jgi:U3 small nucleolar RNA-associated protein 4
MATMDTLQLRTSLVSSAISSDGEWLAVSDLYETKVYFLRYRVSRQLVSASHMGRALTQSCYRNLQTDEDGTMTCHPKRVKAFTSLLQESFPHLARGFSTRGTGATSLIFSPASHVLVIGLAMQSHMIVVEVGDEDAEEGVSVLKSFAVPVKEGSRAVRRLPTRTNKLNGSASHGDDDAEDEDSMSVEEANGGDQSMSITTAVHNNDDKIGSMSDSDSDSEDSGDDNDDASALRSRFIMMSISRDGQWLAGQDDSGRIGVWSLDVLKVSGRWGEK